MHVDAARPCNLRRYANFGDAPPGTAGALVTLATTPSKKKASGGAQPGSGSAAAYFGTPRKPTSPALGAPALPSHISIFGDAPDDDAPAGGGGGSCGAASCGAGVRLPSHISAFGEDVEHDEELLYAARALVGAPPPPHPPICAVAGAFQPGARHACPLHEAGHNWGDPHAGLAGRRVSAHISAAVMDATHAGVMTSVGDLVAGCFPYTNTYL